MKASPDPDALVPQQRTYRLPKPSSLSNQFHNNYVLYGHIGLPGVNWAVMRIGEMALLLLVFLGSASAGDRRADAEALFARSNAALGLGATNSYTIKGHFHVVLERPLEGTFLRVVREPEVWRSEITLPGYSEVVVRNGERSWIRRNTAFTPLQVRELVTALQPDLKVNNEEKVEKITEKMVGTTQANCVKLKMKAWEREVCVDATTALPLLTKALSGRREQVEYEGYSRVAGKQVPKNVRLTEAGKLVAEFSLDSLSADLPDGSLFDPLSNAVVRPVCDDTKIKPPVPISTPNPDYPEIERRNRIQGVVVVQALIDEQGRTHDVVVTRSLTSRLDVEAKAAVLKWRFQPAMCGSTPVPKEMSIEVAFKLY